MRYILSYSDKAAEQIDGTAAFDDLDKARKRACSLLRAESLVRVHLFRNNRYMGWVSHNTAYNWFPHHDNQKVWDVHQLDPITGKIIG